MKYPLEEMLDVGNYQGNISLYFRPMNWIEINFWLLIFTFSYVILFDFNGFPKIQQILLVHLKSIIFFSELLVKFDTLSFFADVVISGRNSGK